MIAARSPFNGTFVIFIWIYKKFLNFNIKSFIVFSIYMKTLINGGNILNSILTGIRIFISSKEAIPYKFIGIRMFVNRLPI